MAGTTTIPDVFDALQTLLTARAGLAGVEVISGPVSVSDVKPESIILGNVPSMSVTGKIGNQHWDERYDLIGVVWVEKPGAGEVVIRAARKRAWEIYDELGFLLFADKSLGLARVQVMPMESTFDQGVAATGNRYASVQFTLEVNAHISRT